MGAAIGAKLASRRAVAFRREEGAIAVMFAGSLIVIMGFMGLALSLSMLYNRKVEMQNVASTVALAAAAELNGTPAGVTMALRRASERLATLPGSVVGGMSYMYSSRTMEWSDAAIEFGRTPTGPWVSAATALAQPGGLSYVQVDTKGLDAEYGRVNTVFMSVLDADSAVVSTSGHAIAGRTAIRVTPMGICAMHSEAGRDRGAGELEEYGFRRGVSYDLMQLNPNSNAAGATFLINPFVSPGTPGIVQAASVDTVKPFICTGTMAMARVTGGEIVVSSPFPLADLHSSFNSRFESYTPPCRPETAPPDTNIKQYTYDDGSVPWMEVTPGGQAAAQSLAGGKLGTVAGPEATPSTTTDKMFGPLWSYAKAARYSSFSAGSPEPASGYGTFGSGDWATLYNPGKPKQKSYPPATPYVQTSAQYSTKPVGIGVQGRRVLNIPLLACPVTGNRATVLAVGKFFMTVEAKPNTLYGEFAGIASEQSLGALIKLYP
ncbi:pilus assembly protein TadG-related protein [Massilia sp. IC2-278]|uniref:pilus assembly protein TadG-related protein n=1 Tax=Massilia sp. IC2-278 TaxID=2887200 RepID=UPI001E56B331|nr:pilus assembly protein TadG-related protein [Massilia sp. IC2-278]MCC2959327.1 pilus assembly protein TadG-related protein [Massilia sp. IC2-278]